MLFFLIAAALMAGSQGLRMSPLCSRLRITMSKTEPVSVRQHLLRQYGKTVVPLVSLPFVALASSFDAESVKLQQPPDRYKDMSVSLTGVRPDFNAVRRDIADLIRNAPDKGPTLVRLAWHSSGTFDKMSRTGGSEGGTIRFTEELSHGANKGLDIAVSWLEPIHKKYNERTDLSYGDLYTLAGVVAVETLGGPRVPWRAGRKDEYDPKRVTPDGRLPEADKGEPKST